MILYLPTDSSIGDNCWWMYDSWNKSGAHSEEWWDKTKDFIQHAFSLSSIDKIRYPCDKCQNVRCFEITVTKHLCWNDFVPHYFTWMFHDEKYMTVAAEEEGNDRADTDRMDEIVAAIRPEFNLGTENSSHQRSRSSSGS
jgi:hypothetical protein